MHEDEICQAEFGKQYKKDFRQFNVLSEEGYSLLRKLRL